MVPLGDFSTFDKISSDTHLHSMHEGVPLKQEIELINQFCKIVVVDDSDYSRKMMVQMLEKGGISVAGEAKNAQEALTQIRQNNANLVIIDIVMPEMSGIELADYIRENFQGIYFIMVSSLHHEHVVVEAISAGAHDFLHKPLDPDLFVSSVYKLATHIIKDAQ